MTGSNRSILCLDKPSHWKVKKYKKKYTGYMSISRATNKRNRNFEQETWTRGTNQVTALIKVSIYWALVLILCSNYYNPVRRIITHDETERAWITCFTQHCLQLEKLKISTTVGLHWGFKELMQVLSPEPGTGLGVGKGGGAVTTDARPAATVSAQ